MELLIYPVIFDVAKSMSMQRTIENHAVPEPPFLDLLPEHGQPTEVEDAHV